MRKARYTDSQIINILRESPFGLSKHRQAQLLLIFVANMG
jgi:uncharacterized protein YejL (UPF0352 family)